MIRWRQAKPKHHHGSVFVASTKSDGDPVQAIILLFFQSDFEISGSNQKSQLSFFELIKFYLSFPAPTPSQQQQQQRSDCDANLEISNHFVVIMGTKNV